LSLLVISGSTNVCNWGDYRIPNSKELDGGVGQMFIAEKFKANGWGNYSIASFPVTITEEEKIRKNAAIAKEEEEWWK